MSLGTRRTGMGPQPKSQAERTAPPPHLYVQASTTRPPGGPCVTQPTESNADCIQKHPHECAQVRLAWCRAPHSTGGLWQRINPSLSSGCSWPAAGSRKQVSLPRRPAPGRPPVQPAWRPPGTRTDVEVLVARGLGPGLLSLLHTWHGVPCWDLPSRPPPAPHSLLQEFT